MGQIVLVTGGARSGKSRFAEGLALQAGGPVVYLATAEASDAEMENRIARHQAQRPPEWTTVESPRELLPALAGKADGAAAVLLEDLSLWTANRLIDLGDSEREGWWAEVDALEKTLHAELQALLQAARAASWDLILVTNEVGWSLHPNSPLGRAFQDMLGRLNQVAASQADAVSLVVVGLALNLKTQR
jgi:adenosylcobinamide kinase/adenosylcobinamide-phosphate guanylyltransferase